MSKKALEHVDARELAEEAGWRMDGLREAQEAADDEDLSVATGADAGEFLSELEKKRSRKNTKSWCKGKEGRPHTLAIEVPPNAYDSSCRWITWNIDGVWWSCRHVELCTVCGKQFRHSYGWLKPDAHNLRPEDCPDYEPLG